MCVEINHAHLKLGNKILLDDVSLQFQSGELTIILGPNGTGKSSLLHALIGEKKIKGDVSFYGRPHGSWQPEALAKSVGVLPQHSQLTFPFRVREVVELGGLGLSRSQKDITAIALEMMALTEVVHLKERLYPSLSGGEKQRVHFARVLTQLVDSPREKILFLDEPTSALDIKHQHATLALAQSYAREGASVIVVLHDINLASQYADRMILLHQGKVVADGKAEEVVKKHLIESVYQCPVNIIPHPEQGFPLLIA